MVRFPSQSVYYHLQVTKSLLHIHHVYDIHHVPVVHHVPAVHHVYHVYNTYLAKSPLRGSYVGKNANCLEVIV